MLNIIRFVVFHNTSVCCIVILIVSKSLKWEWILMILSFICENKLNELKINLRTAEMKCLCRFLFINLQVVHKKFSVYWQHNKCTTSPCTTNWSVLDCQDDKQVCFYGRPYIKRSACLDLTVPNSAGLMEEIIMSQYL